MSEAETTAEFVARSGLAHDPITRELRDATETWMDVQKVRKAMDQRDNIPEVADVQRVERQLAARVTKLLRQHPLWPWLSQYPGLGGVHTARLIARIGNPHRFPGQRCTEGCYFPPDRQVGETCGRVTHDGECAGVVLPPRPGTGVRSVWHWAGLHAVEGRSPRNRRGVQSDWDPTAKLSVLQPGGIAEQIVRLKVPVYREVYDEQKARLTTERGAAVPAEIEFDNGPVDGTGEAEMFSVIEGTSGLAPFQIDAIARKIAAKRFVGDMLMEWKRVTS